MIKEKVFFIDKGIIAGPAIVFHVSIVACPADAGQTGVALLYSRNYIIILK